MSKNIPFLKLLGATISGILIGWYADVPASLWLITALSAILFLLCYFLFPIQWLYRLRQVRVITVVILFICIGGLLLEKQDISRHVDHYSAYQRDADFIVAQLTEDPVQGVNSYKVRASVRSLLNNDSSIDVRGSINIYFSKDSNALPRHGTRILFRKKIAGIVPVGNPGSFDYKQYCFFQGIMGQVFLKTHDFVILDTVPQYFKAFLYSLQHSIVSCLRKYIIDKKEAGLAEALLIGYKEDLDRELVQAYSNTGVVHIIAISGLHLGLIYWLLNLLLSPLLRIKKTKWIRALLILSCLWIFSILAGAQPSILRSAVMFSFIVVGDAISRSNSFYNTLAASAFVLLCLNPFWLWDIGFQLSYSAVLSISLFMKPVSNLLFFRNKWLDLFWKMNAVTIAAQILTAPLLLYHFHQFPILFLITNIVAVPLSSLVLLIEILLYCMGWFPEAARIIGKIASFLINFMNGYITRVDAWPCSQWNGLQISFLQTLLLYGATFSWSFAWLNRRRIALLPGLVAILLFSIFRWNSFQRSAHQQKIIVYNARKKRAVEFIDGRSSCFIGDSDLLNSPLQYNFMLRPSRTLYRVSGVDSLPSMRSHESFVSFVNKKIIFATGASNIILPSIVPGIDVLILSGNVKPQLLATCNRNQIRQVVCDATVPFYRAAALRRYCDSVQIKFHDVSMEGAFEMNIR